MPASIVVPERPDLRVYSPSGTLLTFLFHGVFRNENEIEQHVADPQQKITLSHFSQFVEHMLEAGYQFVTPGDVEHGLAEDGRHVMATFDDGYANNLHVRPLLEEYGVPAVFFISTGHVLAGKPFWWDVLYRELWRRGASAKQISQVGQGLKELTNAEIEGVLTTMFGAKSLVAESDIDRPLSVGELQDFARCPFVHLGNHTRDHGVLTNYTATGIAEQLGAAQDDLEHMVGVRPTCVSYPNGNYSPEVLRAARSLGLTLGITVERARNPLPLDRSDDGWLRLGRFTLWGTRDIGEQCDNVLADSWWKGVWSKFVGRDTRSWQRRSA
jgi:peptidoglycan/xylan/chitin deacetylase (PgdA/CDA1 family)